MERPPDQPPTDSIPEETQLAAPAAPACQTIGTLEIEDFYSYSFQPRRRYGGEFPPHPQIDRLLSEGVDRYRQTLSGFRRFIPQLQQIAATPDAAAPGRPSWINGFFPGLDSVSLFGFISSLKPARFMEIGSGNSTLFAAEAKRLNSPDTHICSIDPFPRTEVDAVCDRVVRSPLQDCDLRIFDELEPGDILFFDGSHRVLQNTDTTVLFLEVFPRLRQGVLIHLHDIVWPFDYPPSYQKRFYSEQYILGALLVLAPSSCIVELPNCYLTWQTRLNTLLDDLWNTPHLAEAGIEKHGSSFWFRLTEVNGSR